jgi:hypothetical protein
LCGYVWTTTPKAEVSTTAAHHGDLRAKQGYTVAMAVEESRLLQVRLHKSQRYLEFDLVLPAVVIIADEVDAQLRQQMLRCMASDAAKKVATSKLARVAKIAQTLARQYYDCAGIQIQAN